MLDFGQADSGELFLLMEYVAGDTLSAVMHAGPLPAEGAPQESTPGAAEKEALALAQFFFDRGEYDSAIEELVRAQRAAPASAAVQRALDGARSAQAAEQALSGAAD